MYIKIAENPLKSFLVFAILDGYYATWKEKNIYFYIITQCLQKNNFVKMCKLVHFVTLKAP